MRTNHFSHTELSSPATLPIDNASQRSPFSLPQWHSLLASEMQKPYIGKLRDFLRSEYQQGQVVYPEKKHIFRAFNDVDYNDVKVVILGQDPYHGPRQAIGRSFAVPYGTALPPSLKNIVKELRSDLAASYGSTQEAEEQATFHNFNGKMFDSSLEHWVSAGVLLLNSVLTVRANMAFSHKNQGWEVFTDSVIRLLGARQQPLVFLLWGSPAQQKARLIGNKKHLVLCAPHPSPLSAHRGFFGCRHFSKTNSFLQSLGYTPIPWLGHPTNNPPLDQLPTRPL